MDLRPAAVAASMLVASFGSGMAMIAHGFGGDIGFDGTLFDVPDSLRLWLVVSLFPIGLITAFIFAPAVALLELHGSREFPPYFAAGAAAGAVPVILSNGGLPASADWLAIFVLPGAAAGLTWWYVAIHRSDEALPNP